MLAICGDADRIDGMTEKQFVKRVAEKWARERDKKRKAAKMPIKLLSIENTTCCTGLIEVKTIPSVFYLYGKA